MRLRNAAVAAVLAGGSLAGTAVAISPAAAAVHPAVTPTVTVTTIDRAGKHVSTQVRLQNLKTGTVYNLTSGKGRRVPDGTYNVGAEIETPGNPSSQTLVDRPLTVSRPGSMTLDARQGRLVRLTVNDPRAITNDVFLTAYSPVTGFEYSGGGGAATYVVPGKLASGWKFDVLADLSSATASGWPVEYGLIRVVKGDIPASPAWFSNTSKLTTLNAAVRRLNPGDTGVVSLTPEISAPTDSYYPLMPPTLYDGPAPYTVQFRLTPGYAWQQSGPYGEELLNNAPVWGAHQYDETFGAATFSPNWAAEQAVEVFGNTLYAGAYSGQWMLSDPAFGGGTLTVTITNPKKAGYVSLRVRAALANGVSTEVTVINAYAIS
jgi:hypothetical protein